MKIDSDHSIIWQLTKLLTQLTICQILFVKSLVNSETHTYKSHLIIFFPFQIDEYFICNEVNLNNSLTKTTTLFCYFTYLHILLKDSNSKIAVQLTKCVLPLTTSIQTLEILHRSTGFRRNPLDLDGQLILELVFCFLLLFLQRFWNVFFQSFMKPQYTKKLLAKLRAVEKLVTRTAIW